MEERINCFSHLALFDFRKGLGRNFLGCFGINKEEDTRTGSESSRPWQELDHDILVQIFQKDSLVFLLWSIPFVCRSWRFALWDALFWNKDCLDLSDLFSLLKYMNCPKEFSNMGIKLDTIKSIFEGDAAHRTPPEGWSQSLKCVILPFGFYISDRILLYIAKRTPSLNFCFLGRSDRITEEAFSKAMACWKEIRFVDRSNRWLLLYKAFRKDPSP